MEKAVLTGALGFVGFHLCNRLLEEGIDVVAIDEKQSDEQLDYFGRNALFTFFDGRSKEVPPHDALTDADVCFHLETLSREEGSVQHTVKRMNRKIRAMISAFPETPPFFIVASSTAVYGSQSGEIDESVKPAPNTAFGRICRAQESLLADCGIPLSVLRFPEVYGPGQPATGSFHRLLRGCDPGRTGDDVLFIDDAAEALFLAGHATVPGTFNVASGKPGQWERGKRYILGESASCTTNGETCFNIEKAKAAFGFIPRMGIEEGIDRQKERMKATGVM